MTSGYLACSFDLLNVRDLDVIRLAHTHCDHLIVGVLSDRYIEAWHGRPPVVPLDERFELVRHVRGVDEVVVHDEWAEVSLPEDCLVFAVGDVDPGYALAKEPVIIRSVRESRSRVLREAIRRISGRGEGVQ